MEPQENKDNKEEGKSCCSHGGRCCGCKAIGALVLLLLGGMIGFFAGRHCGHRLCPIAPASAPAAPAPAPAPAK